MVYAEKMLAKCIIFNDCHYKSVHFLDKICTTFLQLNFFLKNI